MFDFIKASFHVGDFITLHSAKGIHTGSIIYLDQQSIALKTPEGKIVGLPGSIIEFVESNTSAGTDQPVRTEETAPAPEAGNAENKMKSEPPETASTPPSPAPPPKEPAPAGSPAAQQESPVSPATPAPQTALTENDRETASPEPAKTYKAGEKIPLHELEQRMTSTAPLTKQKKKVPRQKKKLTSLTGGLEALGDLILPEREKQNKSIVSANAVIQRFSVERQGGFLHDMHGEDAHFRLNYIIDDTLKEDLLSSTGFLNISVLCTLVDSQVGKSACCIQRPKSVEAIVAQAKKCIQKKEYKTARNLLNQVLNEYPENYLAEITMRELNRLAPDYKAGNYSSEYAKAKALQEEKNYYEAIRYYKKALGHNHKKESCIKDLAMLYGSLYASKVEDAEEREKMRLEAIAFMKEYVVELPQHISTWYFLENFYYSVRDFDKFLEVIDQLLEDEHIVKDTRKYTTFLNKKAAAYIQLKNTDAARAVLENVLETDPDSLYAKKLLAAIEADDEQLQQIIEEANFDSIVGGISKFLKDTLDKYNDYYGIPPKEKGEGDFTPKTLKDLREYMNSAGKARPRERANYLLTEAKLMQELEPEKETDFHSTLASYCIAMALNHIANNSSMDVIRFYFLEAFILEESYDRLVNQISLYLYSFKESYTSLLAHNTKRKGIDEALKNLLSAKQDQIWEGILSMIMANRSISAKIINKIYSTPAYLAKSVEYLSTQGFSLDENIGSDQYAAIWNQAREKRQRDNNKWLAQIKSISESESLEVLINQAAATLKGAKASWLNPLDSSRLNYLADEIRQSLEQYSKQSGFKDRERNYKITKTLIISFIDEIKEKPTKLSYEGTYPLLNRILELLNKSFDTILDASLPDIQIGILAEDNVIGEDNTVLFQVNVENSKNSSPIHEVSLRIENTGGITFLDEDNTLYGSIDGGEHHIFKLSVKVSDSVIRDKAATVNAFCKYKTRNSEDYSEQQEQLPLRLYSSDEYERIENPYAPLADGGPVPIGSKMFYGREEFIANRIKSILETASKQIIIYGQKRCGKSSVLQHLKKGLEDTRKTFCVSFSMGDIIKNLNEFTFYHKILDSIEFELETLEGEAPAFHCPTLAEFKEMDTDNPVNSFIKLMAKFKNACSKLEEWKDKRLIVMIDEFTYLYTEIKKGRVSDTIMQQWKAVTQTEKARFSVVLVGQDVVPSFKKEDYAKNAFGVIEDIRLTYLAEEPAKQLIEKPILDKDNHSRYIGNAVDCIIDYTSRNPYYIQIFCARLVEYMNMKKIVKVTEADIKDVADSFIQGPQALAWEKFDNLIRAGEQYDFQEYGDEPIITVLRQIAKGAKNIGVCSRTSIHLNEGAELEDRILNHLVDREVLELKPGNNYKIQVKLFQEWLLQH